MLLLLLSYIGLLVVCTFLCRRGFLYTVLREHGPTLTQQVITMPPAYERLALKKTCWVPILFSLLFFLWTSFGLSVVIIV